MHPSPDRPICPARPDAAPRAIVIGASAGGPPALGRLLAALEPRPDVGIAVVNHVGADGPDLLPTILTRLSGRSVVLAQERWPLTGGLVHVAPSGYHLEVGRDRFFSLSVDPRVCYSRPAIDVLFASAAEAYGDALAGVVLTGASSDGAEGLKRIRELGGRAFVQEPSEAEVDTMPLAALACAGADLCAPLATLAEALNAFARRPAPPHRTRVAE